jgi:hypothetical protein
MWQKFPWIANGFSTSKKISQFCITRRFITVFTTTSRFSIFSSQTYQFHVLPSCRFKMYFNIIMTSTPNSNDTRAYFFLLSKQNVLCCSLLPHVFHMPSLSYLTASDLIVLIECGDNVDIKLDNTYSSLIFHSRVRLWSNKLRTYPMTDVQ